MKIVTIHISDKAFKDIRTHMSLKCTTGETCGVVDAFVVKIVSAIDDGDTEVGIKMKGEKDESGG